MKTKNKFARRIREWLPTNYSEDPKYIINAAAYTNVDKAEKNMKLCYKINALAPKKIADWAYKNESVLIHFSTTPLTPWAIICLIKKGL